MSESGVGCVRKTGKVWSKGSTRATEYGSISSTSVLEVREDGNIEFLPADEPDIAVKGDNDMPRPADAILQDEDDDDDVDAEIREARAILEESQSIRNSIRDLMAEKVTGDGFMEPARKKTSAAQNKENTAPSDLISAEGKQNLITSGLETLLTKRDEKVSELRDHISHLQTVTQQGSAEKDDDAEDQNLVLFPSDFTRLVDELFQRHKSGNEIEGDTSLRQVDKAATSTKIHEAVAIAFAIDEQENDINSGEELDTKISRELEKVDKLDKDLAKCLQEAETVARKVYPEKYAELDHKRRDKLEKRVNAILERDRKEKMRQKRLEQILHETSMPSSSRLTEEDEKLVEDVMKRSDGDDLMMNPYNEDIDDDAMSETMSAIMQAIERRSSAAGSIEWKDCNLGDTQSIEEGRSTQRSLPQLSSSRNSARFSSSEANAAPMSQGSCKRNEYEENVDYLQQFRQEKEQHQQLKEIDKRLIKLKTSAFPEKLDENLLKDLLADCRLDEQEQDSENQRQWKELEEEHYHEQAEGQTIENSQHVMEDIVGSSNEM